MYSVPDLGRNTDDLFRKIAFRIKRNDNSDNVSSGRLHQWTGARERSFLWYDRATNYTALH